jgi:large subunit ribosomal protein L34
MQAAAFRAAAMPARCAAVRPMAFLGAAAPRRVLAAPSRPFGGAFFDPKKRWREAAHPSGPPNSPLLEPLARAARPPSQTRARCRPLNGDRARIGVESPSTFRIDRFRVAPSLTTRARTPLSLLAPHSPPPKKTGFAVAAPAPRTAAVVTAPPTRRGALLVMANNKKSMGCTKEGTRRKSARVSGFRARMSSTNGKNALARRRAKGRKVLCSRSVRKSAGKK